MNNLRRFKSVAAAAALFASGAVHRLRERVPVGCQRVVGIAGANRGYVKLSTAAGPIFFGGMYLTGWH